MQTLYIIGNGFDLFHKLPTSYGAFNIHVRENYTVLENTFNEYFVFELDKDGLWSDFEADLGTFDWKSFLDNNNNLNVLDEDFRPSFVFCLEDDLIEQTESICSDIAKALQEWLESIDISSVKPKFSFTNDSFFISFNYTMLLEEVYKISPEKILHIHGDIEKSFEELIIGHNIKIEETPELDENGDSNRTMFSDSESAAKTPFYQYLKPVEEIIASNAKIFDTLSEVTTIYVLGHSLNSIYISYFKEIHGIAKKAKWFVSYYRSSEIITHLEGLTKVGVLKTDITLFKMGNEEYLA